MKAPASFSLLLLAALPASLAQAQGASDIQKAHYTRTCNSLYGAVVLGTEDLSMVATDTVQARIDAGDGGKSLPNMIKPLGAVESLGVSDVVHLNYGDVFVCQFRHAKGVSKWNIAYSPMTHMVDDISFSVVADPPPKPKPKPEPVPTAQPAPQPPASETQQPKSSVPANTPATPSQSEACKMFPDLC